MLDYDHKYWWHTFTGDITASRYVDAVEFHSRQSIYAGTSGGASAYILQKIVEEQNAYNFLDSEPQTLSAKEHRPPYGKDGDYFTKPSAEDVFEKVYLMMHEVNPQKFPALY